MFNNEITIGNLIAVGAALISAAAVLASFAKERALKKKELADRVRQCAALVTAKLDRWKQIDLQVFDQLQAAITDADIQLVSTSNIIQTRDDLWKHIVASQAAVSASVLKEEIEIAYTSLFGYDPGIHELFIETVIRMRRVEKVIFLQLLNRTQHDVLTMPINKEITVPSAKLGNKLRETLAVSKAALEKNMESILHIFRSHMATIVQSTDDELLERAIPFQQILNLPSLDHLESEIYAATFSEWNVGSPSARCEIVFESSLKSSAGDRAYKPWSSDLR